MLTDYAAAVSAAENLAAPDAADAGIPLGEGRQEPVTTGESADLASRKAGLKARLKRLHNVRDLLMLRASSAPRAPAVCFQYLQEKSEWQAVLEQRGDYMAAATHAAVQAVNCVPSPDRGPLSGTAARAALWQAERDAQMGVDVQASTTHASVQLISTVSNSPCTTGSVTPLVTFGLHCCVKYGVCALQIEGLCSMVSGVEELLKAAEAQTATMQARGQAVLVARVLNAHGFGMSLSCIHA